MELRWIKSSLSFANGNCIEVAAVPPAGVANWRKARRSASGNYAEVASGGGAVLVRDTKDRTGPVLRIAPAAWDRFTRGLKTGPGA